MTPELVAFLLGATGSLAVELVLLLNAYDRGKIPVRYSRFGFWLARVLFAGAAGLIAWAAYTPGLNNLFYIYVGAAAPALLMQFRALPPPDAKD